MNTEIIQNGKIWHLWSAQYIYDVSIFEIKFYAESQKDAEQRIQAMKDGLVDGGQIIDIVDADTPGFDPDEHLDKLRGG